MFFRIPRIVPLFAVLCTCYFPSCSPLGGPREEDPPLRVYFIDVGQGDACLIRTPGNRWFLYDIGNKPESLIAFLHHVRADTLDAVFISHPDLDHFGAFPALLKEIPIKKVYLPSGTSPNPAWSEALASLDVYPAESDTLFAGDTLIFESGVHVRALWPFPHSRLESNNLSTVLRVEYRSRRILLTGDIEDEAESGILAAGLHPAADLLKVAHHGSRTSSGLPFLAAVQPHWAIISCDSAVYGHPHAESLADLSLILGNTERILRTDREGTIGFEVDGNGIRRVDIEEGVR
jgi:competence protein ComEC